jgi:serine/alanine adding enzyme
MIQIIDNVKHINVDQWKSLISDSTTYSFFQTKACYDFYKSLSFLEVFIFGVSEKNVLKGSHSRLYPKRKK